MIPLVEIPEIVQHFAPHFELVLSEEAFQQFQRYISGLIVSENEMVEGINRIFVVDVRNQNSLNRLLTESPFSVSALNRARLDMLFRLPGTAFNGRRKGVLSLDNTLLTHYGHHFEKIAKIFDPVSRSYVWAHNLVSLHYSDDLSDYPVAFRPSPPSQGGCQNSIRFWKKYGRIYRNVKGISEGGSGRKLWRGKQLYGIKHYGRKPALNWRFVRDNKLPNRSEKAPNLNKLDCKVGPLIL